MRLMRPFWIFEHFASRMGVTQGKNAGLMLWCKRVKGLMSKLN